MAIKKDQTTFLNAEYTIYNSKTDHSVVIRESPEGPGVTEIIHREKHDNRSYTVTVDDKDIPTLIEALWRRYRDSVSDYPDEHVGTTVPANLLME